MFILQRKKNRLHIESYDVFDTINKISIGNIEELGGKYEAMDWEGTRIYQNNGVGTFNTIEEAKQLVISETTRKRTYFEKYIEGQRLRRESSSAGCKTMALLTDGNDEFYPTPDELAGKMLGKIRMRPDSIGRILEPSAGKGNLVDAACSFLVSKLKRYCSNEDLKTLRGQFDVLESDVNLQCLLMGKGLRLVGDDFLTYSTKTAYDLIIMNPGFSHGDLHLLKAISIMEPLGGEIVCLLNAETIRNPYTNSRKVLKQKLAEYAADIEFVKHGFLRAERKTDVETAIVHLEIPRQIPSHNIMDGLIEARQKVFEEPSEARLTVLGDMVRELVGCYNADADAGLKLISEYEYSVSSIGKGTHNGTGEPLLRLVICGHELAGSLNDNYNTFLVGLRQRYWRTFFNRPELSAKMTSTMRREYEKKISEMKDYDFCEFNLNRVLAEVQSQMITGIQESIMALFEKLTTKHSWNGAEPINENIHYYNGWSTNKSYKVGKKCIIPCSCFRHYSFSCEFDRYEVYHVLSDLERAMNYLNKGDITTSLNMEERVTAAYDAGKYRNVEFNYFVCDFFQKGTCHIKFRPESQIIIDRLNIFASRNKNWLPPTYGKKHYEEMSGEEQAVIDSFQGRESYDAVMNQPEKYILASSNIGQNLLDASITE